MRRPTVTLLVRERRADGRDCLGNEVRSWGDPVPVGGCLWAPGDGGAIGDSRPEGREVKATAHFPKGCSLRLEGALVALEGGEWLAVQGTPDAYPEGAVRGRWAIRARLEAWHG